jgi:fused signal recognition particle receptor
MDFNIDTHVRNFFAALNSTGLSIEEVTFFVALAALLIGTLALLRRGSDVKRGILNQFSGGHQARLDKIELTLNELKLSHGASIGELRGEMGHLRQELESLQALLGGEATQEDSAQKKTEIIATPRAVSAPLEAPFTRAEPVPTVSIPTETIPTETTIAKGLTKTRVGFFQKIKNLFAGAPELRAEELETLEELLVQSDLGISFVTRLIAEVKEHLAKGAKVDQESFKSLLKQRVLAILAGDTQSSALLNLDRPDGKLRVVMVVGVNGVGKTTTVGKLAESWRAQGFKVMVAAADTFRAAAVEQLKSWAERAGVAVVSGAEGAKPGTVVFQAMESAKREGVDLLLIDTAGRLHNKANLMAELEGIRNMIQRHDASGPHETWLIVDGATGQNALLQAREFHDATPLTGIIVTKLDGTPKGGIVVAIKDELKIPVQFIGVGEGVHDLKRFEPQEFVDGIFEGEGLQGLTEEIASGDTLTTNAEIRRRRRRAA